MEYPIGTVVRVLHTRAMIVGFSLKRTPEGTVRPEYVLVPWPTGYMTEDSLRTAAPEQVEPISPGYETDGSRRVARWTEQYQTLMEHLSDQQLAALMTRRDKEENDG